MTTDFTLGCTIQLPIGTESTFKGIIDLLEREAEIYDSDDGKQFHKEPVSDDMKDMVEEYRIKLLKTAAEGDDVYGDIWKAKKFPLMKSKLPSVSGSGFAVPGILRICLQE